MMAMMRDAATQTQPNEYFPGTVKIEHNFTKIIDNLFLTSANDLTEANLSENQITHIVNATRTVPLKRDFRSIRVNVSWLGVNNY